MHKNAIFDRNLLAIGTRDKYLSSRCAYSAEHDDYSCIISKTGKKVPAININGRITPLHSKFDPEKEGSRFPELYKSRGFLIFYGFGGGYHIAPFLQDSTIEKILIIDSDLSLFTSTLKELDLRSILLDKRISFLIEENMDCIRNAILSTYLPIITGDLQSIVLRPAVQLNADYFKKISELVHEVLEQVGDDYTVQTRFGKKWFRNTVSNLSKAEKAVFKIGSIRKAFITAAGPSLDENIEKLEKMRKEVFLIATDTSLPALLHRNIKPDLVISIDCQDISYNHFMQGYPEGVPLLLDLASPSKLTRFTENQLYFSSGHPFSIYVNRNFRQFPQIDTSGGNVTYAALSLAQSLGAREIYVMGADFSYPRGKSYALETYLYPWFRNLETRFASLESAFFTFMMHNNSMIKEDFDGYIRYISKPMIGYRKHFEAAASEANAKVLAFEGSGCKLQIENDNDTSISHIRPVFSAGSTNQSCHDFLKSYLDKLKKIKEPQAPIWKYVSTLNQEEEKLLITILPAAAEINRKGYERAVSIKMALKWTIEVIERELNQIS
jgi:hypothetical protein